MPRSHNSKVLLITLPRFPLQREGLLAKQEEWAVTRRGVSYVSGVSDTPLLGLTIGDMFDQIVAQYPDHEALVVRHEGLRLTYRQLQEAVDRCARGLMALGLQQGDRLGL